jgi:LMBR1 domain-containing protein 1
MPQALLFFVYILMYVVLAINVVLMSLAPQYLMYGNQKYEKKVSLTYGVANASH